MLVWLYLKLSIMFATVEAAFPFVAFTQSEIHGAAQTERVEPGFLQVKAVQHSPASAFDRI